MSDVSLRRDAHVEHPGRELLSLALPALGALVAEPVFVLVDTAMVGHLGTAELGGLGVAATCVQTVVGLLIFLAYGTTPAVSRLVGASRLPEALAVGRDGAALALGLGAAVTAAGALGGPALLQALGARGAMAPHAVAYLHGSLPGLTGMLLVLALTGVFRGLGDAKTPLWVAGAGAVVNIGLNWLLIYPCGLGVFGSGLGTSITQWGMALVMAAILARSMHRHGVGFRPTLGGVRAGAGSGLWLFVRSVTMRAVIIASLALTASWGPAAAAGNQILNGVFALTALALDAIAIAAQTLIARELGASSPRGARNLLGLMLRWGAGLGVVFGVILGVCSPWLAGWFGRPEITGPVMAAAIILAVAQPLCAVVFVLDGVLIGASDFRYLGLVSLGTALFSLACLLVVSVAFPAGVRTDPVAELAWTWAVWSLAFMSARAVTLWMRSRGDSWMRLGALA